MKKIIALTTLIASSIAVTAAQADIRRINIHFGGGCASSNTGSCSIHVRADGYNFKRDALRLFLGQKGSLKLASPRNRPLTSTGRAVFRVKNIPGGCYQVRTAPNGNKRPDHASPILCEK